MVNYLMPPKALEIPLLLLLLTYSSGYIPTSHYLNPNHKGEGRGWRCLVPTKKNLTRYYEEGKAHIY